MKNAVAIAVLLMSISGFAAATPEMAAPESRATKIHVDKSDRRLTLFRGNEVLRTYRVRLGGNPKGHKQKEGDSRTPEGVYEIDYKQSSKKFHLSLHVSYPNAEDRARASARGVKPGGLIMVHGGNRRWRPFNWTDGCIALWDEEIEEIWSLVGEGTTIEIVP